MGRSEWIPISHSEIPKPARIKNLFLDQACEHRVGAAEVWALVSLGFGSSLHCTGNVLWGGSLSMEVWAVARFRRQHGGPCVIGAPPLASHE